MIDPVQFFTQRFPLTVRDIETLLGAALSHGGEYADLYFEYAVTNSLGLEEQIVKQAGRAVEQGVGVRVLSGERTGFAYCETITREAIHQAALTAARIADSPREVGPVRISPAQPSHNLYPVESVVGQQPMADRIELLRLVDQTARQVDRRIREVQAGLTDEYKVVLIATSEGRLIGDVRPLARIRVSCIADEDGNLQSGVSGGGGRLGIDYFNDELLTRYAREAARQALVQLEADEAPAGTMEVVLGPGWPGILLHEAVGHGLEADFNRKGTSAFSGLVGQRIASELCTVVDEGCLPHRRGSLNIDDEGNATSQTVLIDRGILRGYLQDHLSARLTGASLTGNGRRESYRHLPMPRMTNTYLLAGETPPEEIIRSVRRGLYAVQFGGGQVDITNGKFVFSASEAYLIEDGRITAPVKGATLIGDGPTALTRVKALGYDLALDEGVGICGKDGQSVPVGVGMPTLHLSEMTVGGTR
ncbi:MAG: metalloprotease TldD [Blastocatellia bacterium]